MERLGRLLTVLILVLLGSAVLAPPAMADSEYLNHIDVTYDVQADGTVDVRYEIGWHFPEEGRHGINLGFATRESWDLDTTKDVLYEITDVRVSSPTGAPAQFVEGTEGSGSNEALTLRIGDPNVTLDTQDATYVVEYTLAGALRTFDGAPQLFWDVNSPNLPELRRFTARVTGPDGVTRARCLVGSTECDSSVDDGVATFSHDGGPGVTSVVAEFPAGSVANAEPVLEDRRVRSAEVRGFHSDVEVLPDGSARVDQQLTMVFPRGDRTQRVQYEYWSRLPWDEESDQVLTMVDLVVRDEQGNRLDTEQFDGERDVSAWLGGVRFTGGDGEAEVSNERTFDISYVLRGAVGVDDGLARLRMSMVPDYLGYATDVEATWRLPGVPQEQGCLQIWYYNEEPGDPCEFPVTVDGTTIVADAQRLSATTSYAVTDFAFPADALTATEPLVPGLNAAKIGRRQLGMGLGAGGALATVGVAVAAARAGRRRDERYATVPPGVVGAPNVVRRTRRDDVIPVRFEPPDLLVSEAGLLIHREYRPQHLAATLVSLAVRDLVALSSKPLMVQRLDGGPAAQGVERQVLQQATKGPSELSDERARSMRKALEDAANREIATSGRFQGRVSAGRDLAVFFLPLAPFAAYVAWWVLLGNPFPDGGFFLGLGLLVGGIVGVVVGRRLIPKPALAADGRALLDQVEGFRQYIATAEAHQLNYEADRDIFRRYLPWAVLFDLTDRWTQVCRDLAEEGRIDPPDTSFWMGSASFDNFGREINRFSRGVSSASKPPPSSSSGGSGGSSGFSSSSSGGGGGGGTSGSSW